jgi:small subunit ribosomal protein S18
MERKERDRDKDRKSTPRKNKVFIKKECQFCEDQAVVDFTQSELMRKFMTETGRILPRRFTGNCALHQRELTRAIKRGRSMQLVK